MEAAAASIRAALDKLSDHVRNEEELEEGLRLSREADRDGLLKVALEEQQEKLRVRKLQLRDLCREFIITLQSLKV